MKEVNKYLLSVIKKLDGILIGIGINDNSLIEAIYKNDKILECDLLSSSGSKASTVKSKQKARKDKKIYIQKLKNIYKKKRIDNIICNLDEVNKYLKFFIRDSIYMNRKSLYLFGTDEIDVDLIIKRYKRYNIKITKKEYKGSFVLIIDTSHAKNNYIIDKIYFFNDTIYNFFDLISTFLVN